MKRIVIALAVVCLAGAGIFAIQAPRAGAGGGVGPGCAPFDHQYGLFAEEGDLLPRVACESGTLGFEVEQRRVLGAGRKQRTELVLGAAPGSDL